MKSSKQFKEVQILSWLLNEFVLLKLEYNSLIWIYKYSVRKFAMNKLATRVMCSS